MNLSRTAMLTGCTIIAALCALTLSSFAAETAFGTAPELDCGSPSDIHDGWVIGSAEQQGLGQRFDGLNHIRRLRRVCMTKCG
jgi:hypothetical protein